MLQRLRVTELSLLVTVGLFTATGLALLGLVKTGQPGELARPGVIFLGGITLAYLWLVAIGFHGDQVLLPTVLALNSLGLLMVRRLAPGSADRQLAWVLVGLAGMLVLVTFWRDLTILKRYRYLWALAGLGLVALTMVFGTDPNGSAERLWLGFGAARFQPSEPLKILLVIFLASYLDEKRELISLSRLRLGPLRLPPLDYLAPFLVMWAISMALLVGQRDLGAALLFFGIFLTMLFVASGRASYLLAGAGLFLLSSLVADRVFAHVHQRIQLWADPWSQTAGGGYQIVQALIALAAGGLLGTGLGYGYPEYIPAVHTDFVFVAIGEELGLAGTLGVLGLYFLLFHRAFKIALQAVDSFNQLLAAGLAIVLSWQTFIILAGNLKLIPLTGITLPFVSYGGSSLVTNYALAGLLLLVSKEPK